MKQLTLIRHAKSSWKKPALSDIDRPLNKRGKRDAPEMGGRLRRDAIRFDHIYASPARRAFKTAKIIAGETGYPKDMITLSLRLYGASAGGLLDFLKGLNGKLDHVAIVGHNPGITDLACILSGQDIGNMPTCAIVTLDFDIADWSALGVMPGNISRFDYPKKQQLPR